jgi:hypothetical protein
MKIKIIGQRYNEYAKDKAPLVRYKKIDENTIEINGEKVYFNPDFIEYNVENIPEIIKAYRDETTNELYLDLLYRYTEKEKEIFENPNYYPEGGFFGTKYEDSSYFEGYGDSI